MQKSEGNSYDHSSSENENIVIAIDEKDATILKTENS